MKPRSRVVAVSQRVVDVAGRGELRDCLDQQWAVWLQSIGLYAVPVPNRVDSVVEFLNVVRPIGVVLTGGNNLALPVYNGAAPVGDAYGTRDDTERALVDYARRGNLPILGCCRGLQFLNAYFGGRLSRMTTSPVRHVAAEHTVTLADGRFREIAGDALLTVNSYHDFGITRTDVAEPLVPIATSEADATVEAVVHRTEPVIGIMWHPERRNAAAEFDRRLAVQLFHAEPPAASTTIREHAIS